MQNDISLDYNKILDILKNEDKREQIAQNNKIDKSKLAPQVNKKKKISHNNNLVRSYEEAKNFLRENNITISTITINCKIGTLVDINALSKYVSLKEDGIVMVKYGDRKNIATNRTIVIIKSKKKLSKKNFYNQVTVLIKPNNNPNRNYINIKIFKNGSLHATGCKDMEDFKNVAENLIGILKKGEFIKKNNLKKHIHFVKDSSKLEIYDIKIRMINSNFNLGYKIDRKKLDEIFKKNHRKHTKDVEIGYIKYKYTPTTGHSCVNIKFQYNKNNRTSIFVFQTGAIIITGAKKLQHIVGAYHYIIKILTRYRNQIEIKNLNINEIKKEAAKILKQRMLLKY